jgi:type II secretory pathway pseudopilin PulG
VVPVARGMDYMRIQKLAIAAAVVILAGCGQTASQQAAQQAGQAAQQAGQSAQQAGQAAQQAGQAAQQGAQSLAQGLSAMAQGLKAAQTGPDGKPITVVDFEKLIALLPQPSGWDRSKPDGTQTSSPFVTSEASANYTKGTFHANVTITDSALNSMVMMPFTMMMSMNYAERSTSGYKKSVQYSGQPGLEEWNSDNKHGEMTMIVNKRYVVSVKGDGFDNMDVLKEIANAIDLNKLAALQ